jgi:hypothetical protein
MIATIYAQLKTIITRIFQPKNMMATAQNQYKYCSLLFNTNDIIIVCVHTTLSGMNPFGQPMTRISKNIDPTQIGNLILDCLRESKVKDDENKINLESKQIFSLASVKNDKALTKSWNLINISQQNHVLSIRTTHKDKEIGWALDNNVETIDSDNPFEIGQFVLRIIDRL